ncbi:MAG: serine/threonine protein kinase [Proteobacteria bacterium]|nr:serine/threonine protein kinase [Pseudomonadota bacterium]HQR03170.1 serine/threonine protein kinase [Rhodocyclaceae bacterium]
MTDSSLHPYATLGPDRVLDAIASVGFNPDGRQLALNSYENRVYQIGIEDAQPLIAKFYRPGRWSDAQIREEHEFVAELAEREIPAVPALKLNGATLHHHDGFRFALFPRQGGRAPETGDRKVLEWMGRYMGRIHAVGAIRPYVHRPALDMETFGIESRDWLLAHGAVPVELREAWHSTADLALSGARRCFDRAGDYPRLRLHADCHPGNVLWTDQGEHPGPHFVDFDDSRMGPAIQDLWMLLSGTRQEMQGQLLDCLAGYEDFADFEPRQLHLIEALRTLRLLHFSAWLARRWDDPAFPVAFPWFASVHYWQDRILELREQTALMDEAPIAI